MAHRQEKLPQHQARLFSTLAALDDTDRAAARRRQHSRRNSLQQSAAAADQTKLQGILLELRILTQRCLTEERGRAAAGAVAPGEGPGGTTRVREEVDALLENLLVARRDLLGHHFGGAEEASAGDEEEEAVDYATLIRRAEEVRDDAAVDEDESSASDDGRATTLDAQLDTEYAALQTRWKAVLNKHHANVALHSGLSANSAQFQSRAVDVSFWDQVQGALAHERGRRRAADARGAALPFDDAKLYQHLLRDVIALSQAHGATAGKTNKRGLLLDPSQEAAARLKRAVRKKTGGAGDVDLTALLTEAEGDPASSRAPAPKKTAAAVDRKASKGRKLRYAVHAKMVNFTFPVARAAPLIQEDVWFKSLFGGVGNTR